jgi:hypothetical protein
MEKMHHESPTERALHGEDLGGMWARMHRPSHVPVDRHEGARPAT